MAIPRFKLQNIGSIIKIEYAPSFAFLTFNNTGAGTIAAAGIVLANGFPWQTMYCSPDTMGHQQDQQNTENLESWMQQIVGFVPGDELAIETGLLDLSGKRFVLRITLPNDAIKIVGSPDQPLDFALKSSTGTKVPDRAGTGITFSGYTLKRALFLI